MPFGALPVPRQKLSKFFRRLPAIARNFASSISASFVFTHARSASDKVANSIVKSRRSLVRRIVTFPSADLT